MPSRKEIPGRNPLILLSACLAAGAVLVALPAMPAIAAHHSRQSGWWLSQDDEEPPSDENEVPPQEVEKYIKVYKAMQKNKTLTVEQATAQQGLSVSAFRSLEDKIERNDALREHVRDALKPSAAPSP